MTPNYVAKKSALAALNFWLIIFFWLIIPLIIQIARILTVKSYSVEFYDDKVIIKCGVLNKGERQSVFAGVFSIGIYQSFWGRIFDFGDIEVDCPGNWDIDTDGIKDPQGLRAYLESRITTANSTVVLG